MDIVQEICSVPEAEVRKKIAVIPVDHPANSAAIKLGGRLLWMWSVQYAKEEGFQPIVVSTSGEVRQSCLHAGITYLNTQHVHDIFKHYTCDLLAVLDPRFPLRPKGMLRNMSIILTKDDTLPMLRVSSGSILLYDAYVYRRVHDLIGTDTRILVTPEVCGIYIKSQQQADELEEQLKDRHLALLNPWFNPKYIGIVLANTDFRSSNVRETMYQCDLTAKIIGCTDEVTMDFDADVLFSLDKKEEFDENSLVYSIYEGTKIGRKVVEMPCILAKNDLALKLKDFTAILAWFHLSYPEAKIIYYGNPNLQSTKAGAHPEYAARRSFSRILEKNIWDNITSCEAFEPACNAIRRQGLTKSDVTEFDDSQLIDPAYIDDMCVIHAIHDAWSARLVISKKFNRGCRQGNNDKFTCLEFVENGYLHVLWDRWGEEYYIRQSGTNIWTSCSKEDVDKLKKASTDDQ